MPYPEIALDVLKVRYRADRKFRVFFGDRIFAMKNVHEILMRKIAD